MEEQIQTIITDFADRIGHGVAARDSNAFVPLTSRIVAAQFETALTALIDDDIMEAQQRIGILNALGIQFQIVRYPDPHNDGFIAGFVEYARPGAPTYRGWGGVLVRTAGLQRRVYQAPHVLFDAYTFDIALRAFMDDPDAAALMVAGAHRYANGENPPIADVTRTSTNVFHALTAYLAHTAQSAGVPLWFIQFHGSVDRPLQPMITASNGAQEPEYTKDDPLVRIKRSVVKRGLTMGVCGWENDDDETYLLCGTENIQGLMLERMGLRPMFMHFEIERRLRHDFYNNVEPSRTTVLDFLRTIRTVLDGTDPTALLAGD